ncbi:hypothetical protein [Mesorhizobium sp.]|uniref:hypothetical protein n=1 Tax=Mesorhizobium sp. TaxID=1871066 RepID=UPI00257AAA9D|nr:hypothetical protein [Mesorhizobium sp.]
MTDDREGRLLPLREDQLWRSGQNVAKWRWLLISSRRSNGTKPPIVLKKSGLQQS